jgi:hypothetical protein
MRSIRIYIFRFLPEFSKLLIGLAISGGALWVLNTVLVTENRKETPYVSVEFELGEPCRSEDILNPLSLYLDEKGTLSAALSQRTEEGPSHKECDVSVEVQTDNVQQVRAFSGRNFDVMQLSRKPLDQKKRVHWSGKIRSVLDQDDIIRTEIDNAVYLQNIYQGYFSSRC